MNDPTSQWEAENFENDFDPAEYLDDLEEANRNKASDCCEWVGYYDEQDEYFEEPETPW